MSFPSLMEGLDSLSLAQEGERQCRLSNYKGGINYLELALKKGVNTDRQSLEALSAIYSQLGNAYFAIKNFTMALHYHKLDLETAKKLEDESGIAKANGNIGNAYKAIGDFKNAYDHSMQHLTIARTLRDKECESRALYNLASVLHCRAKARLHSNLRTDESTMTVDCDRTVVADLHCAIDYYLQNLAIVEESKDWAARGRTYGNLGNCYYMLGEYNTAIDYHNKRLELARRFGDRSAMKRAYTNLGNAFIFLKQTAKAVEYYRLALDIAVELKDEAAEAQCCFNAGNGSSICGEHSSAADYHVRYLLLCRNLKDRLGEIRACAALAADFKNLSEVKKAAYFYAIGMELASKNHEHTTQIAMRNSIESLYRNQGNNVDDDICSLIEFDSSADPEPRPVTHLNTSIQSLLCPSDCGDCGLSRRGMGELSTIGLGADEQQLDRDDADEDFFERLSRMQGKRLNDQRCDPDMLAELTNRNNGLVRQSDTLMSIGDGDAANMTQRTRRRFADLFRKIKKQKNRNFGSFQPPIASTPRQRPFSMIPTFEGVEGIVRFDSESNSEGKSVMDSRTDFSVDGSKEPATSPLTSPAATFRVPVAPPRRTRTDRCSIVSLDTGLSSFPPPPKQDGMFDLIASLQGRRMEEQRAVLSGQEDAVEEGSSHTGVIEVSEDAGQLYDLVIRSQGDRLDEQRSELPVTHAAQDVSQIVLTMQKGRIEAQRASLEPRNAT